MAKDFDAQLSGFNPFGDLIGLKFLSYGDGKSRCEIIVEDRLFNPNRVLHGGAIYTMADTGMGGALYSVMELSQLCATIEIKISYFLPVRQGTLVCDSEVVNHGSSIATLESTIYNGETRVAKAYGSFYIFEKK